MICLPNHISYMYVVMYLLPFWSGLQRSCHGEWVQEKGSRVNRKRVPGLSDIDESDRTHFVDSFSSAVEIARSELAA